MPSRSRAQVCRVAAAQYPIGHFQDWSIYAQHARSWVLQAVDQGSQILLLPEYASMELVSLFPESVQCDLRGQLYALQALREDFRALYRDLAREFGIVLVPGTFPWQCEDGTLRNRAFVFGPEGELGFQDKLIMTRFENEQWIIHPGDALQALETPFGRIGISICYDAEFPLIARRLVEQGADLILVPSCTDTLAGYHRVRIGCQARALENQCFVVQSPTVGRAEWSEAVDVNIGRAGFFTPVDRGFPDTGVLVEGELNQPQWLLADLDLTALSAVRQNGQVLNTRDWPRQYRVVPIASEPPTTSVGQGDPT